MAMNISCKFEKASYNIFFVRAVTVKSLYSILYVYVYSLMILETLQGTKYRLK